MNEFDADYIVKTLAHISKQLEYDGDYVVKTLDRISKTTDRMENKLKQNDYKGEWNGALDAALEAVQRVIPDGMILGVVGDRILRNLRALRLPEQPQSEKCQMWNGETPRWKHDHDCCTFLGRYTIPGEWDCDLWGCDKNSEAAYSGGVVLMARYSDEPSDYTSNRPVPRVPEYEAKRRWAELKRTEIALESDEIRPQLQDFIKIMEQNLQQNDYKGGWSNCDIKWLLSRLKEETVELEQAIENKNKENIVKEAADVANFAMMIADNSKNDS